MDILKRSRDGKIVFLTRYFSRNEGPFRFDYVVHYRAEEKDECWELVSFKKNSFVSIKSYDRARQRELVEKYGPRAFAVVHAIAEKPQRVPKELFQAAQLQLI